MHANNAVCVSIHFLPDAILDPDCTSLELQAQGSTVATRSLAKTQVLCGSPFL